MRTHAIFQLLAAFSLSIACSASALQQETRVYERAIGGEQHLKIDIDGAYSTLRLKSGSSEKLYLLKVQDGEESGGSARISYTIRDGNGILKVQLDSDEDDEGDGLESLRHVFGGHASRVYVLELTDKIPMDFSMELDAGEADLDLTGLRLASMKLETGASELKIRVQRKNPITLHSASISAGVGSIRAQSLGNLNFERMSVDCGVGSSRLDLTGDLRSESRLSADLGMGSLVIYLPAGLGVRLVSDDSFLSATQYQRFVRIDDDRYETQAFESATKKMNIRIDSGIGSVAIKWK
jgi:hypothetical protein